MAVLGREETVCLSTIATGKQTLSQSRSTAAQVGTPAQPPWSAFPPSSPLRSAAGISGARGPSVAPISCGLRWRDGWTWSRAGGSAVRRYVRTLRHGGPAQTNGGYRDHWSGRTIATTGTKRSASSLARSGRQRTVRSSQGTRRKRPQSFRPQEGGL